MPQLLVLLSQVMGVGLSGPGRVTASCCAGLWWLCAGMLFTLVPHAGAAAPPPRCAEPTAPDVVNPTSREARRETVKDAPPLIYALGSDRRPLLRAALSAGADPNVCVPAAGASLLTVSAVSGDTDEVVLLLTHGAQPDAPRDANGGTALLASLSSGKWAVARALLLHGADPRAVTDGGTTALHEVAIAWLRGPEDAARQLELADQLIRGGAAVNAQAGATKGTALMIAALQGRTELVARLLAAGAERSLRNAQGQSALDMALQRKHLAVVELLRTPPSIPPVRP